MYNALDERITIRMGRKQECGEYSEAWRSFEEAESVFPDDAALLLDDPEHSENESRFLLLGMSRALRILVVCHCYRETDDIIRIISARKATKTETRQYIQRRRP